MSRPASTGLGALSVNGSTPPTRSGVRTGTAFRTAKAAESPMEALTHALIKKMREKFAEVSNDVASQEIIAKEVTEFMLTAGSVREEDLSHLADKIRARLTGETPNRNTLASMKRAQQQGDEWAKIYALHIKEGRELDDKAKQTAAAKAAALKQVLASQVADRAAKEQHDRQEELDYAAQERAQLREWEAAEAAKRAAEREAALRLKGDRAAQLADRNMRKRLADEKRTAEEAELAARLAYEARAEFEKEEAERKAAKEALKAFLLNNESLKAIKEAAKQQEWAADKAIMEEYATQMEKQEAARRAQVEKLKAWQAAQEREAAVRPEAKRWIDPAIVERYTREAEAAAAAEDERRKAAVKASSKVLAASLAEQLVLRETLRHAHDGEEQAAIRSLRDGVAAEQARRAAERAAEEAKKVALKAALEEQMKLNATRRVVAPMSQTEKLINKQLLEKVAQAGLGQLGAGPAGRTTTAQQQAAKSGRV
ncbi:hypothetical protein COO60DRAFT_846345 [Scenedesmus sp. NREL 46B-D3]|nr:hypothetical protein COO60DRAFT_846345 [Scenedesmus sp. NREL 46B-D3]